MQATATLNQHHVTGNESDSCHMQICFQYSTFRMKRTARGWSHTGIGEICISKKLITGRSVGKQTGSMKRRTPAKISLGIEMARNFPLYSIIALFLEKQIAKEKVKNTCWTRIQHVIRSTLRHAERNPWIGWWRWQFTDFVSFNAESSTSVYERLYNKASRSQCIILNFITRNARKGVQHILIIQVVKQFTRCIYSELESRQSVKNDEWAYVLPWLPSMFVVSPTDPRLVVG